MANPNVRLKRSSVAGKRPEISQVDMGELALNTNDGRLFTRKYNVGIGSTVTLLNPWTENIGGSVYYNDGNVGIGTTNPGVKLDLVGNLKVSGTSTLGITTFTGSININDGGTPSNTTVFGSYDRLIFDNSFNDTARGPNKITLYNDTTWIGGFGVHDNTVSYYSGNTHKWYKSNNETSFTEVMSLSGVGTLQLSGGAYVSGSVGIGTTNPTEKLEVSGNIKANNFFKGTTPLITGVGISSNNTRVSTAITDFNFVGAQVTAGLTTATVTIVKVLTVGRRDTSAATINAVGTGITMLLRSGSVATLTF